MKTLFSITILLLLMTSCIMMPSSRIETISTDLAIKTITNSFESCGTHKTVLRQQFHALGSIMSISLKTEGILIIIEKGYRLDTYNYRGISSDNIAYDITIGRPHAGDAIVMFTTKDKSITVDLKCR